MKRTLFSLLILLSLEVFGEQARSKNPIPLSRLLTTAVNMANWKKALTDNNVVDVTSLTITRIDGEDFNSVYRITANVVQPQLGLNGPTTVNFELTGTTRLASLRNGEPVVLESVIDKPIVPMAAPAPVREGAAPPPPPGPTPFSSGSATPKP